MSVKPSAVITDSCLVIERHFNASPERVWQAWTDPSILARWFGPAEVERVVAQADLKIGGAFSIELRVAGKTHALAGSYCVIEPPHRLVFTWAWQSSPERESLVSVELSAVDGGTALTLSHQRFADQVAVREHAAGWQCSIEALGQLLDD